MNSETLENTLVNELVFKDINDEWDQKVSENDMIKDNRRVRKKRAYVILVIILIGIYALHSRALLFSLLYGCVLMGLHKIGIYDDCNPLLFFTKPLLYALHICIPHKYFHDMIFDLYEQIDQYYFNWPTTYRDDWEQESIRYLRGTRNNIQGVWKQLKLDEVIEASRNMRITTTRRDQHRRPTSQKPYKTIEYGHEFNLNYIGPALLKAGMDDDEFIRMVEKRLADRIKPVDFDLIERNQYKVATRIIRHMPIVTNDWSMRDYISYALKSKGSAGRWGKHKMLEGILKDDKSKEVLMMWEQFIKERLSKAIEQQIIYVPGIIGYEIYKKNELLGCDVKEDYPEPFTNNAAKEVASMKVTRMIQAPHLPVRVMDAFYHVDWNDSYAQYREQTYGKVGVRYLQDISRFMDPMTFGISGESDFKDYDCSNSPQKIRWCAAVRLQCKRNDTKTTLNEYIKYYRYLKWKAEVHLKRTMQTTWNVRVNMVGGLASGDITTSDDGTLRTEVYIEACKEAITRDTTDRVKVIDGGANGDDTILKMVLGHTTSDEMTYDNYLRELSVASGTRDILAIENVRCKYLAQRITEVGANLTEIIGDVSNSMGLYLKILDVVPSYNSTFLTCKPGIAILKLTNSKSMVRICVPYRQFDRHYKKMCVSESIGLDAELDEDKSKTVGKLISYMCLSAFMPVAWIMCLVQLRKIVESSNAIEIMGDMPWLLQSINLKTESVYNPYHLLRDLYGIDATSIELIMPDDQVDAAMIALEIAIDNEPRVRDMARSIRLDFNRTGEELSMISWDLNAQSEQIGNLEYKAGFRAALGRDNWTKFMTSSFEKHMGARRAEHKDKYDRTTRCKHVNNLIDYQIQTVYFPRDILCSNCLCDYRPVMTLEEKAEYGAPAIIIVYNP